MERFLVCAGLAMSAGLVSACFDPKSGPESSSATTGAEATGTEDPAGSSDAPTSTNGTDGTDGTPTTTTAADPTTTADTDPSPTTTSPGDGSTTEVVACQGGLCCPDGEPLDGISCGVGCECEVGEALETVCSDRTDNDEDLERDCADMDCVGVVCLPSAMIDFVATADTWVRSSTPDANYNTSAASGLESDRLEFGGTASSEFETYLAFDDVTALDGVEIISATLQVFVHGNDDDPEDVVNTGAYEVVAAWDETTLTWTGSHTGSSQDLLADEPSDTIVVGDTDPGDGVVANKPEMEWYSYDVTAIVASWVDGSHENFGLAIAPLRDQAVDFASEDVLYAYSRVAADLRPRLWIEYRSLCTLAHECPLLTLE